MAGKRSPVRTLFRVLGSWLFLFCLGEAVWVLFISPGANHYGATRVERTRVLPGDAFVPNPASQSTFAITVDAPPEEVWRWLVQIGQDRGGFYSYTFLENLVGADIRNRLEIRPEWQELNVGDAVRLSPGGKGLVCPVLAVEPPRFFYLKGWGAFVLEPAAGGGSTRFIIRGRNDLNPGVRFAMKLFLEPIHFIMQRRMMLGIKQTAEAGPVKPAVPSVGDHAWFLSLVAAGLLILIRAAGRFAPEKFAGTAGAAVLVTLGLLRLPPSPLFGAAVLFSVLIILRLTRTKGGTGPRPG